MNAFEEKVLFRKALAKAEKIACAGYCEPVGWLTATEIDALLAEPSLRMSDNPHDLSLGSMLSANPDDPDAQKLFAMRVMERFSSFDRDDPFYGNYPPAGTITQSAEDISAGEMPTGDPLAFPHADTSTSIAVIGATGSGKTECTKRLVSQLVSKGHLVIAVDRKRQYRDLVQFVPPGMTAVVFDINDLRLALFQSPLGNDVNIWANSITEHAAGSYGRISAQRLLRDQLGLLYARKPAGESPSLAEVILALYELKPRFGFREAEYRDSILYVLKDLYLNTGETFNYVKSDFLDVLFEKPGLVVIEAHTLSPAHFAFTATYLMTVLHVKRTYSNSKVHLPVDFVLEDITTAIQPKTDWDSPSGVSPLANLVFMMRQCNMGSILVCHTLQMSELILKNTAIKLLMGLHGEDPRQVQRIFGLTSEQCDRIRELRPGELIALIPSVWPKAVYGRFEPLAIPGPLSNAMREQRAREFLARVTAVKGPALQYAPAASVPSSSAHAEKNPASPAAPKISLSTEEVKILMGEGEPLTLLYAQLGVSRAKGAKLVNDLESRGMARTHSFTTGKQGGAISVVEVTEHGWQALKNLGMKRPAPPTGGGWEHNWAARLIQRQGRNKGHRVRSEVPLGSIRADVEWRDTQGQLTYFNIGISDPEREAANTLKAIKLAAVQQNEFILVCRDAEFARKFRAALRSGSDKKTADGVKIMLVTDFLS